MLEKKAVNGGLERFLSGKTSSRVELGGFTASLCESHKNKREEEAMKFKKDSFLKLFLEIQERIILIRERKTEKLDYCMNVCCCGLLK